MCTVRSHFIDSHDCSCQSLLCYCIRKLKLCTLDVSSYTLNLTSQLKENQRCVSAGYENSERSSFTLAKRQNFTFITEQKEVES